MFKAALIKQAQLVGRRNGYEIYKDYRKLNIWGIRSKNEVPNTFDDELHVFFNNGNSHFPKWEHFVFPITTDPGTYWLKNPMSPQGTAMLAAGQYVDVYKIDLHRGKYYALCQRGGNVTVIRDYNRNAILDFYNGIPDSGSFGINIHRANKTGSTFEIDRHSAGCQVFQNAADFDLFMRLCEMHRELHGNYFTYTLIDRRMEARKTLKRLAFGVLALSLLTASIYWIKNENKIN